jgi:anaerobic ribonucleoside-triphosphate reductase activating protein
MVPETWDPDGGYPVDPSELAQQIAELPDIEGITVSGGEVFQQPEAAARFLTPLKAIGLNTWLYTGYTVEELVGLDNPHIDALLALTDVLVDGRFLEQGQSLCFRGSANQRIIPLTDALPLGRIDGIGETRMDITLDMHGRMMLVGIPPRGFLRSFRERMKVRGLTVATDNF